MLVRLIPALNRLGIEVATVKHTHHNPAVGDDDCRSLAAAGAVETLVASTRRFALISEFHGRDEPPLEELITRFKGIDLLLIEGFKWASHPKLEVWDAGLGKPLLATSETSIVAVVSDLPVAEVPLPRFVRDDVEKIAQFISRQCGFLRL